MNLLLLIDTIISALNKLAELIVEWRQGRGEGHVEGVGSLSARVDAIVQRQAERDDLASYSTDEANAIRRRDALAEMEVVGIKLRERDRRLLLESALLRSEMKAGG